MTARNPSNELTPRCPLSLVLEIVCQYIVRVEADVSQSVIMPTLMQDLDMCGVATKLSRAASRENLWSSIHLSCG